MRRLLLLLLAIGLLMSTGESPAQRIAPEAVSTGAVTILTDGIADPQGDVSKAIGQLAQRVNEVGKLRVLPLMGQGGAGNVRDLLHLRGIDFAILSGDILAYVDLVGGYPEARRRIRYVTPLFDEKVYLIARKRFSSMDGLRERKVMVLGQDSPAFVTAKTLFGLLKIDVEIITAKSVATLSSEALGEADALLLLGRELARTKLDSDGMADLRVLPIPLSPRLAGVYRASKISGGEIPSAVPGPEIETVQVPTLLTVFDWKPSQVTRHQPVVNFIKAFFEVLPEMQRTQPALWGQTDVNAAVPDWERYGPADALRKGVKSPLPQPVPPPRIASAQKPAPAPSASIPASQVNAGMPEPAPAASDQMRVVVSSRPPLTDANQPGGGLITELLAASLQASGRGAAAKAMKIGWASNRNDQLNALLGDAPVDMALPWEMPDCDRPNDLTAISAIVCDRMSLSDPIFQVIIGLFVRADSEFAFETDDSVANRVFCTLRDADTADLNRDGRNWLSQRRITLVRAASLIDCLDLVERREADAVITNELEGRFTLERLGLSSAFRMLERPLAMRGIHAIVAKDNPKAEEMLKAINDGLAQIKKRDTYPAAVQKHLLGILAQQGAR